MGLAADDVADGLARLPGWAWALPAALLVALGVRGGLRIARFVAARRSARARRLGEAGAARALELLARARFTVLGTEVVRTGHLEVDGRPASFRVRADALVERRGEVWVVEVKGGEGSSSVADRGTRRQLLEYAYVFGARGVLLVDAGRGRIHHVRFPAVAERPGRG